MGSVSRIGLFRRERRILIVLICGFVLWIFSKGFTLRSYTIPEIHTLLQDEELYPEIGEENEEIYLEKENGTFYTYIPDITTVEPLLRTVQSIEGSFNRKYGYDWVFAFFDAGSEKFPDELKSRLDHMISGSVHFEEITLQNVHFGLPKDIEIGNLRTNGMTAGHYGLIPNHRYLSFKLKNRFAAYGFQFLPSLQQFKYVWNVDVGTEVKCDIQKDMFKKMTDEQLLYGFSYAPVESILGVRTLFEWFEKFMATDEGKIINDDHMLDFVRDAEDVHKYNLCNLESNMAIIDMDLLRTQHYKLFFEYMDSALGIFYDRWTDYNLKTLYLSAYVPKSKILWIPSTGYSDALYRMSCPLDEESRMKHGCTCDPRYDLAFSRSSCLRYFLNIEGIQLPPGVRPTEKIDIRFKRTRAKGEFFEKQYQRLESDYEKIFMPR